MPGYKIVQAYLIRTLLYYTLRFCISDKLLGVASTTDPEITLWVPRLTWNIL